VLNSNTIRFVALVMFINGCACGLAEFWAHQISTMNSPQKSLCRISAFASLLIEKGWIVDGCG
jgi:hypothetical protein